MRIILGILIGASIGFVIGYFGRCSSGMCPLITNPIISTLMGALLGALMVVGK